MRESGGRFSARRNRGLVGVGLLYLATNIGYSFFFLAFGTILLEGGVPLGTVALVNLVGVLYAARFLLAPIVDRHGSARLGQYRGWLICTQLGLLVALAGLAPLDPVQDLPAVLVVMAVVLVLSAFHDTALNGLAVRLIAPADHGLANGIQIAGASLSVLIGSSGALLLYSRSGWTVTVCALGAVFLVPLGLLTRLREPSAEQRERPSVLWTALADSVRQPRRVMWILVVIPLFGLAEWLGTAPQSAMMLDVGWSMDRIATVQSVAISVQVVAAFSAGVMISRWGRSACALVFGTVGGLSVLALLPLAAGETVSVLTSFAVVGVAIAYGAKVTWFATISMQMARRETAATDYSVPMSLEGAAVTVINSAGLAIAAAVGFAWLLAAAVFVAVVGTGLAAVWVRGRVGR